MCIPYAMFTRFAAFVMHLGMHLADKIYTYLLEGLRSCGGFKLRVSDSPKFLVLSNGKTMHRIPKSF